MNRSKKIFLGAAVIFAMLLAYASYDISSRTTFPGSKPQLQERIKKKFVEGDTTRRDTLDAVRR